MSEIMKIEGKPVVNYIYFLGEKVTDEKIKAPTEVKADQRFTQWISTNTPYRSISAYAKYVGYFTGYETNDGTIYVNGNSDELRKNSDYVSFGGDILSFKDVVEYFLEEDDLDEALYGRKEIDEFFSLCDKLGLKTLGDLKDFANNNKNRIIVNDLLSKYDSSMSTDAFFETLRDRVKEMPNGEFKYDDPLNVIKNRNKNESLDKSKLKDIEENFLSEAISSKDINDYCDTTQQEDTLKLINRIAKREGVNLSIGTKVGKYPQSLIIDHSYQDNAIRIYPNGACTIKDKKFGDWQLGYDHINIDDYKKGITDAIKNISPKKEESKDYSCTIVLLQDNIDELNELLGSTAKRAGWDTDQVAFDEECVFEDGTIGKLLIEIGEDENEVIEGEYSLSNTLGKEYFRTIDKSHAIRFNREGKSYTINVIDGSIDDYWKNEEERRKAKQSLRDTGNNSKNESFDDNNTKNSIEVEVKSGINGDGFKVIVKDTDGSIIEQDDFSYGYNASYNKSWADKDKPFVTDIINSYLSKYNLSKDGLILTKGKNTFKDKDISDEAIARFKTNYLSESIEDTVDQYDIDSIKLNNGQVLDKDEYFVIEADNEDLYEVASYVHSIHVADRFKSKKEAEDYLRSRTNKNRANESLQLTEGHEQYDYKGFSIDLDGDQFHSIKRQGSGNIMVEIKIGDKVYATVNGYDAAEEWIDMNGQKILDEIEAERKRKQEEELKRNEKEKLLIDMLNRINSKNDFYDFRKDSDPGISKSVHLDKEHLGKLLRLGSAGNYKGAIPVNTDIEGIDLFANIYDVGALGYDLEYGVGAFGDFDSLDRAFNNDAYVFIFRNITFNNREAADEWLTKLINNADTIVKDLIDEEWKDSGFENYDSIFESFSQEGSKLIPEDMSAAEDIRADILHSIDTTAKFSSIETKAADEKAFYSVTPIDGDTGRKIELLIGERYDNVEMIPYTEDWSEELYSYEGSDLIQVEIKIYL